ncbi:Polynucleotide 5'-hydroxyl-kinase grc3 [Sporothrix eucalyptigena]
MSAFALRKQMLEKKEAAARAAQAGSEEAASAAQAEPAVVTEVAVLQPTVSETENSSQILVQKETELLEKVAIVPPGQAPEQRSITPPTVPAMNDASMRLTAISRQAPVLRSSFQPNKENFHQKTNGHMLLKLVEDERLVILGSYGLTVKCGSVTLAGAILRTADRTHWVHAPRCYALPVLRCTDDATVILQPHPAGLSLQHLGNLSPMFSRLWNESSVGTSRTGGSATFQILFTSEDDPISTRDLTAPPEWNKLISELAAPKKRGAKAGQPVLFVCGPKSSGKSTFSRLLSNRLLTRDGVPTSKWHVPSVAVLDIDPGQPEFGTPGSLSLVHVREPNFSPPFCRPYLPNNDEGVNKLLRSHELASVSPATDPEHYIESVLDLHSLYCRDLRSHCPLIVNTPGWVQGTGLEILIELINKMRPSQVIYMSQEGPDDTVAGLKSAYQGVPLMELPSQPGDLKVRTAAHFRMMQTMSYFHLDTNTTTSSRKTLQTAPQRQGYLSWQAAPVTAIRPWMVPYTGSQSGILGVVCYDTQTPADILADSINGTIVSIVAIETMAAFRAERDHTEESIMNMQVDAETAEGDAPTTASPRLPSLVRSPEGIPCFLNPDDKKLDPRHSHKLGAALVRGIDSQNKELHLLTPLPMDKIIDDVMQQDCVGVFLVSGKFDLPTWAYTEDLCLQSASKGSKGAAEVIVDDGSGNATDEEVVEVGDDGDVAGGAHAPASSSGAAVSASGKLSPSDIPWVETLLGNEKRDAGSRVWRVRRDLGRSAGNGGGGD